LSEPTGGAGEFTDLRRRPPALADEFAAHLAAHLAAVPHAEDDVLRPAPAPDQPRQRRAQPPHYGERVIRNVRALLEVGAVAPALSRMRYAPLKPPYDGTPPTPGDAARMATAPVAKSDSVTDGTIGRAVGRSELPAIPGWLTRGAAPGARRDATPRP
jgi:hypothetical protein